MINNQKALCGEGIEERKEVCGENGKLWGKMFRDEELVEDDWKMIERFSEMLGEDISSQRRRIGGDWVVAGCLPQRRMRDLVKANLEKELVIVCLVMEQELVRERISSRHQANEAVVRGIMVRFSLEILSCDVMFILRIFLACVGWRMARTEWLSLKSTRA